MSVVIDLPDATSGEFACHASWDGSSIVLHLTGSADLSARDTLSEVLDRLHSEALRLQVGEVILDIMQLRFLNAACFKCFISWIVVVSKLPPDQLYRIRFRSNVEMLWQRRSLQALQAFAAGLVSVET